MGAEEATARSAMADWLGAAMYAGRKGKVQARVDARRELRQYGSVPAFTCSAPIDTGVDTAEEIG